MSSKWAQLFMNGNIIAWNMSKMIQRKGGLYKTPQDSQNAPFMPLGHNLPSRFIDNLCAHTTLLSCWKAAFIAERSYTMDFGWGRGSSQSRVFVIWCCGCLVFAGLYQHNIIHHLLFSITEYNVSINWEFAKVKC